VQNYYADILAALAKAGVRFVVGGGVAAVLHGVERMTMDIDVALDMTVENLQGFLAVMRDMGMKPRVPVPPEFILLPDNVTRMVEEKNAMVFTFVDPTNPLKQVDVFLTPELSYTVLYEDSTQVTVRGQRINLASISTLLASKRRVDPPRPKDLHDIAELEKLMGQPQ
jgi:hypothetical protein